MLFRSIVYDFSAGYQNASGSHVGDIREAFGRHVGLIWATSGNHSDGTWESSGRHLAAMWTTPGSHLDDIWESSGRHLGVHEHVCDESA